MMHSRDIAPAQARDHSEITRPAPRRITLFPDHAHDLVERRRADDTLSPWAEKRGDWNEELVPEGRKDVGLITPLFIILMAFAVVSVVAVAIAGG